MRLDRLVVHGVLAFKHVDVDFAALPPGLVAIVGANGSGKTSLMECALASLYRKFASRPGSLYDYAHGRDSYIEAVWTVGGSAITTRINLDVVARRSEAVAALDGAALTDGKSSTFDAFIGQTFPSFDLILATAYAAQSGNGSFRSRDQQARKDLFVELIGADKYDAIAKVARDHDDKLRDKLSQRGMEQTTLTQWPHFTDPEEANELFGRIQTANEQGAEARRHLDLVGAEVNRHATVREEKRVALTQAEKALASASNEYSALENRVRMATSSHDNAVEFLSLARQRFNEAAARIADEKAVKEDHLDTVRQGEQRRHAGAVRQLDESLASARRLTERRDEIDRAVRSRALSDAKLEADEAEIAELREVVVDLRATLVEARSLDHQVSLLADVPCGGKEPFASCEFLTDAQAARKAREGKSDIGAIEAALTDYEGKARKIAFAAVEVRQQRDLVHGPVASLVPMLEDAELRVAEGDQKHAELTAEYKRRIVDHGAAAATLVDETVAKLSAATVSWDEQRPTLEQRVAASKHERGLAISVRACRLPHLDVDTLSAQRQFAADDYDDAMRDEARAQSARADWTESARIQEQEARDLEGEMERRTELTEKIQALDVAIRALSVQQSSCLQISTIFGRNGLPLLEIDAAGPAVSDLVNRMLAASFGGRFKVNLVTQKPKRSGEGMRDVFDLSVFDGADERAIADLSGGEQVVVDEAVKAALALYSSQRSGTSGPTTCWRDETTGALDGQNLDRYIAMLRTLRDLGGFERVVFVTHSQDAANSADAILRVADGAVTVSTC